MNPRQRRGVLLLGLAAIGALGVFVAMTSYVSDVQARVGDRTEALQLTEEVPAYQEVPAEAVERVSIPERWMPATALTDMAQTDGLVTASKLAQGSLLQEGMLEEPPSVEDGEREVAIMLSADTGVIHEIGPGSVVDIFATFGGTEEAPAYASIAIQRARITNVGKVREASDAEGENAPAYLGNSDRVPVTFTLPVDDALRLSHIEAFASSVRLALRAPRDDGQVAPDQRRYQPIPPTQTNE